MDKIKELLIKNLMQVTPVMMQSQFYLLPEIVLAPKYLDITLKPTLTSPLSQVRLRYQT